MEAVILIGIQASGKSTFYLERFAATHFRINLDTLKNRRREQAVLDTCIQEGRSFVVDNTNILARERAIYIAQARQAGYRVIGYFFPTSLGEAFRRNRQREGNARIAERGIAAKYYKMEPPTYDEGFDQLYSVAIREPGSFIISSWDAESPKDRF